MRVIGTAGHVDHGKSTLVQALSGINPDRLQEEKARGMTIDLGFAWIDLPMRDAGIERPESEPVGIVDVPGHIDFIKNMLAGVGSIDAAMLIIAADEGVMPQTREHLAILDLLAVPAGVIVLTKIDLIDETEWLDLVELDVVDLLHETRLADAPIVRVSAATGTGLNELRYALAGVLAQLAPRRNRARPRLPIDRIFSLSGFGTVVTGTLSDGTFTVGDAVEILPGDHSARIRGLQTHKKQIWEGQPGSRLAINLSGVGTDELRRGEVVVKPNTLRSTLLVDVAFRLLADAPKPLVHNQAVDFFSGAAEVPARARVLGVEQIEPGQEGWLQLRLEQPVVVAAGDRYILRQPSPSQTLGGGVLLSPHPRRRWKRFDQSVIDRLRVLAQGTPEDILLQALMRTLFLTPKELIAQSGLDVEIGQATLDELRTSGAVVALDAGAEPALVTLEGWENLLQRMESLLAEFHRATPLRRGMPRGELRSRLQSAGGVAMSVRLFNTCLDAAVASGRLEADDAFIWQKNFRVTYTLHQQAMVDALLAAFAAAAFTPPNAGDALRILGDSEELLESLVEQGRLVRLPGNVLFRTEEYDAIVTQVQEYIRTRGSITLADARDLLQTSRKYAQALLEEMDARRMTRRDGDMRVLRS